MSDAQIGAILFILTFGGYGLWITRKDPNANSEQESVNPQEFVTKAELEEILKAKQLATKADLQGLKGTLLEKA